MSKQFNAWVWALIALAGIGMAAALGMWQLGRAHTKEAVAAQIKMQNQGLVLDNNALAAIKNIATQSHPQLVHRRVRLHGQWAHDDTAYLDNRPMAARVGFYVLTPLLLTGGDQVVWVQRGWVPRDFQDRTRIAALPQTREEVVIEGRVLAAVPRIYELGKEVGAINSAQVKASARDHRIWQNLPQVEFSATQKLLPFAIVQTQPTRLASDTNALEADGLLRDWPPIDAGLAKHYGYAFQWFALALLILVLYVWFQFIAPRRARK